MHKRNVIPGVSEFGGGGGGGGGKGNRKKGSAKPVKGRTTGIGGRPAARTSPLARGLRNFSAAGGRRSRG